MYKTESGRTLIELLGVIAIGGLLTTGAIRVFQNVKRSQNQIIMVDDLRNMNENIQILFAGQGEFSGINTSYLIKAGALKSEKTSISDKMDVASDNDTGYILEFSEVSFDTCAYFALVNLDFVSKIRINNYASGKVDFCNSGKNNTLKMYFEGRR